MNVDLQGLKDRTDECSMDGLIIHKGRRMTNTEIRQICNYGIKNKMETAQDIPDEIVDKICNPYNSEFSDLDDTPDYYSLDYISQVLHRIQNCYRVDWDADDLMEKIKEEI